MDDQDRTRWVKLVADFESSELTQREFASERGVSFSNLGNWLYKLRKETRPLVTDAAEVPRQAPKVEAARKGSRLAPVEVVASAAKPRTRALVAAAAITIAASVKIFIGSTPIDMRRSIGGPVAIGPRGTRARLSRRHRVGPWGPVIPVVVGPDQTGGDHLGARRRP